MERDELGVCQECGAPIEDNLKTKNRKEYRDGAVRVDVVCCECNETIVEQKTIRESQPDEMYPTTRFEEQMLYLGRQNED